MSSWMDASVHNGVAFNDSPGHPSFMPNSTSFDPSQFQQQRMNGATRNQSPSYLQNPIYQTNPVVPSKRQRPMEDGIGDSPRQTPGMPSRSQTPQAAYPGFQPNGQPQQPNQYSHLQHNGSANASPSPVMSNQLRPGGLPPRVSTSPHPFSPAAQQYVQHASPDPRSHTPQQGYSSAPPNDATLQQAKYPGHLQNFSPHPFSPVTTSQQAMSTPQMYPPQQGRQTQPTMEQQNMMYQVRLQQQLQQSNLIAAQQRLQGIPSASGAMAKPPMQVPNSQYPPQMRPQQAAPRMNPDQFMKQLSTFMQSRGMSLDMNPIVGDRQINLVMLYMAVNKCGGYKRVCQQNQWAQVAQALKFNPMQSPSAPQQIKGHYERNLMLFEEAHQAQQAQQRQKAMMQQPAGNLNNINPQMSPTKQMNSQPPMQSPYMPQTPQSHMLQQQHPMQTQQAQTTPMRINQTQQSNMNGFTPNQNQLQSSAQAHARNSLSREMSVPAVNGALVSPSPASAGKVGSMNLPSDRPEAAAATANRMPAPFELPAKYDPKVRIVDGWGGMGIIAGGEGKNYASLSSLCEQVSNFKPNIPSVMELGVIDIHAITMSLQSGIHAEVRLALDTLATLSVERVQLDLKACEDLIESIVDCAEVQVELLAENAAEVSDVMLISSYEDVVRGCRAERDGLQDVPTFGSPEYELDRSVERLICITTILRNLSFYETNHSQLADELVVKFLCTVIRYLGTRNMLLRTHANTLDFMKDAIIFLSNLATSIEIPGKEQALCLLHFLLAFAPYPQPCNPGGEKIIFSSYDPAIHRYLPPAVDSLAKLLARDEPNRTFYKAIFASDVTSSPPYDLLTKAFGLAISTIPGHRQDQRGSLMQIVEARKPHLMQGMLAADILSNLIPSFETSLARAWLTSEDGFAQALLQLVTVLASAPSAPIPQRGGPPVRGTDEDAILQITLSGITILRRLSEKARNVDDPSLSVPLDGMIKQENLLGALLLKGPAQPRTEVMRQLCQYAALEK